MPMIYQPAGRAREYADLACNIYRGCDHGCTYCYAPAVLRCSRESFHGAVTPRGTLAAIETEARKLRESGATAPVLLCFTSDPYSPGAARCTGWTRACIEAIHRGGLEVTILSKGGDRALADLDLLHADDQMATTLTLWLPGAYEPGAASTEERIHAIRTARLHGIYTWASFEPVIDPDQTLELLEAVAPWLDRAKIGTLNHMAPPSPIDWNEFGHRAQDLCRKLGLAYYLKQDLRDKME